MNWPKPKPIRNADSTSCGLFSEVMWNADAMSGNAGSIMSIASGLSAMIEAITMTNSGKPIGRCRDDTTASAFTLATRRTSLDRREIYERNMSNGALHNPFSGMAAALLSSRDRISKLMEQRPSISITEDALSGDNVMHLSNQSLLVIIVVGIVAGWLAGRVMEGWRLRIDRRFAGRSDRRLYRRLAAAATWYSPRGRHCGSDHQRLYRGRGPSAANSGWLAAVTTDAAGASRRLL